MMTHRHMTDWRMIAEARGLQADPKVLDPLKALETLYEEMRERIALESEPAVFPVLPVPGERAR
jgi:hypothetical protein